MVLSQLVRIRGRRGNRAGLVMYVVSRSNRNAGRGADLALPCRVSDPDQAHELEQRQLLKLEAIGQLAGGIAHDFNNLLTVITGYAETLLAALDPADPKAADVLEIRRAAERASMLTQQLLAFSRKQVLELEVLDVNQIVGGISAMVGRLIGGTIELSVSQVDAPATVLADRGQLEQVVLNLAVNARDAMPAGGVLEMYTRIVQLGRKARLPLRPGPYVVLSVQDTGAGMTPEVRARIFEPFFTTKPAGEGTGIGLSTVYGIVKQLGGAVDVDSEPERGTRFDVYLPLTRRARDTRPRAEEIRRRAGTILLVDDYRRVRELARKILTRQGYGVLTAASGVEALEIAARYTGPIDLLVSDVVMAGMSGPELARRLQQQRPSLSVLYVSGYAADTLTAHGLDRSAAGFLQKPFTPAALAQKVREVLGAAADRSAARR